MEKIRFYSNRSSLVTLIITVLTSLRCQSWNLVPHRTVNVTLQPQATPIGSVPGGPVLSPLN